MPKGAKFYICKKCLAGCRADMGQNTLKVFQFNIVTMQHETCCGDLEIVGEDEVGVGQNVPIQKGNN